MKTEAEIRAEAFNEFAERIIKYYTTLKGSTNGTLVAFHIKQILNDIKQEISKGAGI